MADRQMIHVRLDRETAIALEEEARAEGRSRNAIVAAAISDYLRRHRLRRVIDAAAGSVAPDAAPWWSTPEEADCWIQSVRSDWER